MFRFIIRDVLWLTVVVALGLGWLVHSGRLLKTIRQLELSMEHEKARKPTVFRIDGKDRILRRGQRSFISVEDDGSIQISTPTRSPSSKVPTSRSVAEPNP